MAAAHSPPSGSDPEIDWNDARRRLKAVIRHHLQRVREEELEDLASQALLELLRVLRKDGNVRNLNGLVRVIGRTTAIDEIRRRTRESARRVTWPESLDRLSELPDISPDAWDDRLETLWFLMLEFFRKRKAPCRELALSYAELGTWKAVAEARGMSHAAVLQQWSRCVRVFREALKRSPGAFRDWLDGDDGV